MYTIYKNINSFFNACSTVKYRGIKVISSQAVILSKLLFSQYEKLRDAMSRIVCSVQDFKDELKTEENINKKKIHYFLR